ELYPILKLPCLHRACIDATGLGMQLAERAKYNFGWKVEPITFSAQNKQEMAFGLLADFQDLRIRIPRDEKLRNDLRALKKHVSISGNIRLIAESDDSHCDRFWAKALRQHAARRRREVGAFVA